jgi:hypothetical protein
MHVLARGAQKFVTVLPYSLLFGRIKFCNSPIGDVAGNAEYGTVACLHI